MAALLTISPDAHLTFKGPFNEVVTSILTLQNITNEKVCFKVKTTAPRRYCVRPNSGLIDPGQTMEVSIMLQPFQYDPNERNNHKFMVQSMTLSEENAALPLDEIWKNAAPGSVVDKKLRCQFEVPADDPVAEPAAAAAPVPAAAADAAAPAAAPVSAPATIDQTFISSASTTNNSAEVQKANEKIEMLMKENANLKKRVAEAASRQVAPADQSYHNAAFHIIFVIIGWLIAKFVI